MRIAVRSGGVKKMKKEGCFSTVQIPQELGYFFPTPFYPFSNKYWKL